MVFRERNARKQLSQDLSDGEQIFYKPANACLHFTGALHDASEPLYPAVQGAHDQVPGRTVGTLCVPIRMFITRRGTFGI